MWFIPAFLSAITYSFRSILEKKLLSGIDKYVLAFGVRFFALPFFILALYLNSNQIVHPAELPTSFWLATIYVSFISTPIEMIFFYKALQKEEVSYVAPLLSLAPIITMSLSAIIFDDPITLLGVVGLLLIVSAVYLLNTSQQKESLLQPFKNLYNNIAAKYVFIMMIFYSLSMVVDKVAIGGAGVYYYAFMNYLLVSISLLIIMVIKSKKQVNQLKKQFMPLTFLGLIVAAYTILRFIALEQGNAGYVSAVASTSVLFTIIFGVVFLREKRVIVKVSAGLLILVGLSLIKIFG